MSRLFVVATPIGNMEDLSPRAIRVLSEVSLIAAEDTRHTGMMLKRLGIGTPMLSNHGFNERARVERFLSALESGDVALVSDSGTPAISDPGAILVREAALAGHDVFPVPGPSAVTASVSASGLVEGPFAFLGFLPRGSGERGQALDAALQFSMPFVLYETGPRIVRFADELASRAPNRDVVVFRELTKLHEEAMRTTASGLSEKLAESTLKGEFVVVVGPGNESHDVDIDELILDRLQNGERPSAIARNVAHQTGVNRSDVYIRVLALSEGTGEES